VYIIVLCLKYLRARRGVLPSILAIATGVTALTVVIAVMNGFGDLIRGRIRGSLSDVVVQWEDVWGVGDAEEIRRGLLAIPHVVGCSAHLTGIAFLSPADEEEPIRLPVQFVGLEPGEEQRVGEFGEWLVPFDEEWAEEVGFHPVNEPFVLPDGTRPERPVILGAEVGDRLMSTLPVGARVLLVAPISWDDHNSAVFTVTNYYKSGLYQMDHESVFLPLSVAQGFRRAADTATSFHLKLDDFRYAPEVVRAAKAVVAGRGDVDVKTWRQMRRQLLTALVTERTIWVIVLTLLLVLAGFSILAVLNLIVFQRRRDIGIVLSIGGSRRGVAGAFLLYGLVVGLVGSGLGACAGLLILRYLDVLESHLPVVLSVSILGLAAAALALAVWGISRRFGRRLGIPAGMAAAGVLVTGVLLRGQLEAVMPAAVFPRSIFYLEGIPWKISPATVVLFSALGLTMSVLASLVPARRAAGLLPAEVIHRKV